MRSILLSCVAVLAIACGPNGGGGGGGDGDGECDNCTVDQVCAPDIGCADCVPGNRTCSLDGDSVLACNDDGTRGEVLEDCGDLSVCNGGACLTACQAAANEKSNIGCEYWAVDLDNEWSDFNDAAGEQYAVAIANASQFEVRVVIEQNNAPPGMPIALSGVESRTVPAGDLIVINLPQREVDGALLGMNEGTGTNLSSRAYRIRTDFPVVAYQFNPIVQSFSNGASLLIPTPALDSDYWVLGWSTSNPIPPPPPLPPISGIPDHSYVTVVGVTEQPVSVDVDLAHDILGGSGIAAASAGDTVRVSLGQFDVLNLETTGIPGDMTGTRVRANGPVAVFTGGERASVPIDVMPPEPAGWSGDICCTEHFEQQLFPTVSLGKEFVITRSPIRSQNPMNPEGDVYRVLGTQPGTEVTTNLPSPYDRFTVGAGEYFEFWSINDFVLFADKPIIVGQYLVAQDYVENPDVGGDPEFIIFPPAEQHREEYLFLTPTTFDRDYCVIAAPSGASVTLDGQDVTSVCQNYDAGSLGGVPYAAWRCAVQDGVHRVVSDERVGVTVYGYYNVGSYGYPAGSEVKRINID